MTRRRRYQLDDTATRRAAAAAALSATTSRTALLSLMLLLWAAPPSSSQTTIAPPGYYCNTSGFSECTLCNTSNPCSKLPAGDMADDFYAATTICVLPQSVYTTQYPSNIQFPASDMCSSTAGVAQYPIYSKSGGTLAAGQAYVFVSYTGRLFVTLRFDCAWMFSTQLEFDGPNRVQMAISSQNRGNNVFYSYSDVLFSLGFYTCYTLSFDLTEVCNDQVGAVYNPSFNDPNLGTCLCNVTNCYQDLSGLDTLYINVNVELAQYTAQTAIKCGPADVQAFGLAGTNGAVTSVPYNVPSCVYSPPPPPSPLPPSPPPPPRPPSPSPPNPPSPPFPPPQPVTIAISSPEPLDPNSCVLLNRSTTFLLSYYAVSGYQCQINRKNDGGWIVSISIFFYFIVEADAFIDILAPVDSASKEMKYILGPILQVPCGGTVTILGHSPPRVYILIPGPGNVQYWPELICPSPPPSPPSYPPPILPPSPPNPPPPKPPPPPHPPSPPPPSPPPSPSPPRPPPAPPAVLASFVIQYGSVFQANICPAVVYTLDYQREMLYTTLFPPIHCNITAGLTLVAILDFTGGKDSRQMIYAFNTNSIGVMVAYLQLPCDSIIQVFNAVGDGLTFSASNVPQLVCSPHPPSPPPAPPPPPPQPLTPSPPFTPPGMPLDPLCPPFVRKPRPPPSTPPLPPSPPPFPPPRNPSPPPLRPPPVPLPSPAPLSPPPPQPSIMPPPYPPPPPPPSQPPPYPPPPPSPPPPTKKSPPPPRPPPPARQPPPAVRAAPPPPPISPLPNLISVDVDYGRPVTPSADACTSLVSVLEIVVTAECHPVSGPNCTIGAYSPYSLTSTTQFVSASATEIFYLNLNANANTMVAALSLPCTNWWMVFTMSGLSGASNDRTVYGPANFTNPGCAG